MSTDIPVNPGRAERHGGAWRIVRYLTPAARVLMGLLFTVTGLNGFLRFLPEPDPSTIPPAAGAFIGALANSGYMFPIVMGTQLIVGLLLLANRFVPLALVLIAPVIVNIIAFHLFLSPSGMGLALVVVALEVYLVWAYRSAYRPMFAVRATTR